MFLLHNECNKSMMESFRSSTIIAIDIDYFLARTITTSKVGRLFGSPGLRVCSPTRASPTADLASPLSGRTTTAKRDQQRMMLQLANNTLANREVQTNVQLWTW
jgi:hypothetical protein